MPPRAISEAGSSHQDTNAANNGDVQPMKRRRTNSTGSGAGSVSSLDDSGLSICGSSSRTSSPTAEEINRLGVAHNNHPLEHGAGIPIPAIPSGYMPPQQPSVESLIHYQQQLQQHLITMQSFSQTGPARPSWLDFALYFSRNNGGAVHPNLTTPMLSPSPLQPHPHHLHSFPNSAFELASPISQSPAGSPVSVTNEEKSSAPKCRSFTIDAILSK